jgi:subtilisin family serine protease
VQASGLPAPTGVYTTYLPLVLRSFANELFPNDPHFDDEWGLEAVEAPRAWSLTCGYSSVTLAVLDTGTDLDHPDLVDKVRTDLDYDFVNDDNVADDDAGHGTHVSGIAAAATNNERGVAGLGWETTLLPIKVLDDTGYGNTEDLADAIRYAADNGADVINMSLGGEGISCSAEGLWYMREAISYAYEQGVVLIAAAGNTGTNTDIFPANCEHVLGVAATSSSGSRATYSTYGDHVSVAAPGSYIYSTGWAGEAYCSSGYCYKSGTSMATPHVAGLAALLSAHYPDYTPDQIASAILDNAEDRGAEGWDPYYGCGTINAYQALSEGAHGSYPACLGTRTWAADPTEETQMTAGFVAGEIIVSFQPGVRAEQMTLRYGTSAEFLSSLNVWRLHVRPGQEQAILARLQADPAVARAALNYEVTGW